MSSLAQVFIAPRYPSWADRPFSLLVPKEILRRGGASPFVALGPVRVERRFRMVDDPEELVLVRGRPGHRAVEAGVAGSGSEYVVEARRQLRLELVAAVLPVFGMPQVEIPDPVDAC